MDSKKVDTMTKHFPDPLIFKDAGMVAGSRVFELTESFRYLSSLGVITVPAGFVTDGASIPKVFWSIMSPFGEYFEAAVIHDFLYSRKSEVYDRFVADNIFKEAMYNIGVPWPTREIIYRAVRLFGWRFFKGEKP